MVALNIYIYIYIAMQHALVENGVASEKACDLQRVLSNKKNATELDHELLAEKG